MQAWLNLAERLDGGGAGFLVGIAAFGAALLLGWAGHRVGMRLAHKLVRRTTSAIDDSALRNFDGPTRLLVLCFAALSALSAIPLGASAEANVRRLIGLVLIAAFGWMLVAMAKLMRNIVEARHDVSVSDNLQARRARTRAGIVYRIAVACIIVLIACLMLMSFPSVRHVGLTLFASAGLAGLAVGAAAQPALKNLIAGIQLAFTEPIRLDDVVIMEGEWGRIEEIRLTYVVVRVWDDRRLIVPVSRFLEAPFQNWTRQTAAITGTVFFYLDYRAPIDGMRTELERIVKKSKLWDRRVCVLQVTDLKEATVEVRALVSAANAGDAFDLRCEVREQMIEFLRRDNPQALPRVRAEVERLSTTDAALDRRAA